MLLCQRVSDAQPFDDDRMDDQRSLRSAAGTTPEEDVFLALRFGRLLRRSGDVARHRNDCGPSRGSDYDGLRAGLGRRTSPRTASEDGHLPHGAIVRALGRRAGCSGNFSSESQGLEMTRYARQYMWVSPDDCDPPHGLDLTVGSRDTLKVEMLTEAFARDGFDSRQPALVGYPLNGRIQLLSGTHRHEAARRAGIRLPVRMVMRSEVEAAFGTALWAHVIRDLPLAELEHAPVKEGGTPPGLDERVDLSRDLE